MKTALTCLLAFASLGWCAAAATAQSASAFDALVQQDLRLGAVADRLLTANSTLCRLHMPVTGMILHSQDQYRDGSEGDAFANGPVAIAALVPGSPASAALAPGDGLAAIGAARTSDMRAEEGSLLRNTAFAALANQPPAGPVTLAVVRDGSERALTLAATPGCRALVEIDAAEAINARSDGKIIQVNYGVAAAATDEELAVVFAHEMAHLVLEHRRRLEAAGVEKGLLGEFGRNQRLNRQVEVEADRMTAHLLANAGYDPRIAPAFWRSPLGRRAGGGIFRSRVYPSAEARAQLVEREIADYLAGGAPSYPGHLLGRRDEPFD